MKSLLLSILVHLAAFSFISCQTETISNKSPKIDPVFEPYIEDFIVMSSGKINRSDFDKLNMEFVAGFDGRIVGLCRTRPFHGPEITIDAEYFKYAPSERKKILVFHELGHCICNRGHDNRYGKYENLLGNKIEYVSLDKGYFPDTCPISLMHPDILTDLCISKHKSEYIKELFENCNP